MSSQTHSRQVVVGYDASSPSEAALKWAARAAKKRDLPLLVLHAAERIQYTQDEGSGVWDKSRALADAKDVATGGAERVTASFPDVEVKTAGSLFTAKVALGEVSTNSSMMVLGTNGRGKAGSFLLGSTAYAIAGYARCPVVIVQDGADELPGPDHPIVVGVNGTPGSERAIETAIDAAHEWGSPISLVSTWAPAEPWTNGPAGYTSVSEASKDYQASAEKINAETVARVSQEHPNLKVTGTVVKGKPVDSLVKAAAGGGLLVVGKRGYGSLVGSTVGSTTLGVLNSAKLPIMVVD